MNDKDAALNEINLLIEDHPASSDGAVIWLTGLSGSGKTTISLELKKYLSGQCRNAYILDGDKIRTGLCADLGFSPQDRCENIRRVGEVAKLFCDAGLCVIVAFISPYHQDRDRVRSIIPKGKFVEVFVECPVKVCEQRDPKGLYKKARQGQIKDFTGITAPYEAPCRPEVHLRTDMDPIESCTRQILDYLSKRIFGKK